MRELHLQGWLYYDYDGCIALTDNKDDHAWRAKSIQRSIGDYFNCTEVYDTTNGTLGGLRDVIPNVSMRMYVSNEKSSLDESVEATVLSLFGEVVSDIGYEGYSEWTITGYSCNQFTIGGHNLENEFKTHVGKWVHLIIEQE